MVRCIYHLVENEIPSQREITKPICCYKFPSESIREVLLMSVDQVIALCVLMLACIELGIKIGK